MPNVLKDIVVRSSPGCTMARIAATHTARILHVREALEKETTTGTALTNLMMGCSSLVPTAIVGIARTKGGLDATADLSDPNLQT